MESGMTRIATAMSAVASETMNMFVVLRRRAHVATAWMTKLLPKSVNDTRRQSMNATNTSKGAIPLPLVTSLQSDEVELNCGEFVVRASLISISIEPLKFTSR